MESPILSMPGGAVCQSGGGVNWSNASAQSKVALQFVPSQDFEEKIKNRIVVENE